MASYSLFDLVIQALPPNVPPSALRSFGKVDWWLYNQRLACAYALRKCSAIDWDAYLNNYQDVRTAGVDPILHFLTHGVFEGRKLFAHSSCESSNVKVSMVVYNCNSACWLEHSLKSVIGQTLEELEIVVVDDASCDASLSILQRLAAKDRRIRILTFRERQGRHRARRAGVSGAVGEFVMFLDSVNHYRADACEIAYAHASEGYDIVIFGVNLLAMRGYPEKDVALVAASSGCGNARVYKGEDLTDALFANNAICQGASCMIFKGDFARAAFADMEDFPSNPADEIYEMAALGSRAHSMLRIDDKLSFLRLDSGYPNGGTRPLKKALLAIQIVPPLRRLIEEVGIARYYDSIMDPIYNSAMSFVMEEALPKEFTSCFNELAESLDIVDIISKLSKSKKYGIKELADKFQYYYARELDTHSIKTIGLLWDRMDIGGTQNVIKELIKALVCSNYSLVLFLEKPCRSDNAMLDHIKVVYYCSDSIESELSSLNTAIKQNHVDIMLCHKASHPNFIYTIIMLKFMNINVIGYLHESFYNQILYPERSYSPDDHASVLRVADKIITLSRYDELYHRIQGVDAEYIPNPVKQYPYDSMYPSRFAKVKNKIVVCGRLEDRLKDVNECLYILKEVTDSVPDAQMVFIGDFHSQEALRRFKDLAMKLGVVKNMRITGWQKEPERLIAQGAVLLSTSLSESFCMVVCEAQALGLPVVMYDLPIAAAEDNPAIIRVPHGDIRAAAREILALLGNEVQWRKLSSIARDKMRQFAPEIYAERISSLLSTFTRQSNLSTYNRREYSTITRTLAYYGGLEFPWRRQLAAQ